MNKDKCVSFNLDNNAFRGRLVRLDNVLKEVFSHHKYPDNVGAGPSISRNHMRGIEDMVEQNDNSFDGIINNVPAAPVPDFAEINEKADQEDIIADTKASVMEKIKEQQEKVKLAPIPEPEKKTPVICPCREM